MVEVPGRGQQHVVARLGQRQHCDEEGEIAARRDDDLARTDFCTVDGGLLDGEDFAQGFVA